MYLKIKNDSELIEKNQLTDSIFFLKYSFIENFEWAPGQYVGITTSPAHRRSYSIVDYDGQNLSFLVDIRPKGRASIYFKDVEVGDKKQIIGPYGKFLLQDTNNPKIFISTGTGIAPIIPMIKELSTTNIPAKIFSGARLQNEDIALIFVEEYLSEHIEYHQCITREEPKEVNSIKIHSGRVTQVIEGEDIDWKNTEFYICGGPEMISDVERILREKGADKIILENFKTL